VAEPPVQSQLPVKPNRPLNSILGVFLGALLSIGSVVIAEFLRDTVLTPRELEKFTGERVLASLPNTGRARRVKLVESPEFAEESVEEFAADVVVAPTPFVAKHKPAPKLAQPKIVHDPLLEWAAGE
jgi:hypothetical protein